MADDTKYAVLITFPDNAKTYEAMTKLGDSAPTSSPLPSWSGARTAG